MKILGVRTGKAPRHDLKSEALSSNSSLAASGCVTWGNDFAFLGLNLPICKMSLYKGPFQMWVS